jgi:hypothetical protein
VPEPSRSLPHVAFACHGPFPASGAGGQAPSPAAPGPVGPHDDRLLHDREASVAERLANHSIRIEVELPLQQYGRTASMGPTGVNCKISTSGYRILATRPDPDIVIRRHRRRQPGRDGEGLWSLPLAA